MTYHFLVIKSSWLNNETSTVNMSISADSFKAACQELLKQYPSVMGYNHIFLNSEGYQETIK